jgi:hypothetical protein
MSDQYHSIKWIDENTATRRSKEVDIKCQVIKSGEFIPGDGEEPIKGVTIKMTGTGDCVHHLVEDSAILLKKMCNKICGEHSI